MKRIKQIILDGISYLRGQYAGMKHEVAFIVLVLSSILLACIGLGTGLPVWLDFLLFAVIIFGCLLLGRKLFSLLYSIVKKIGAKELFGCIALFVIVYLYLETTVSSRSSVVQKVVIAGGITCVEVLFFQSVLIMIKYQIGRAHV